MPVEFVKGDLFDAKVEALVNPVNTRGVMGKGVALEFKKRFPSNYYRYVEACKNNELSPGGLFVTRSEQDNPKWIVNVATKKHWKDKSDMNWIIFGLVHIKYFVLEENIETIAMPALGVGNGGLSWQDVKKQMIKSLPQLEDTEVFIYEPHN